MTNTKKKKNKGKDLSGVEGLDEIIEDLFIRIFAISNLDLKSPYDPLTQNRFDTIIIKALKDIQYSLYVINLSKYGV